MKQYNNMRTRPRLSLGLTLLICLFSVWALAKPQQYSCTDRQSAAEFNVRITTQEVQILATDDQWHLSPIQQVKGVYLFSETEPGDDDERIITTRMFRFDPSTGRAYLLERSQLRLDGFCHVNQTR